MNPKTVESKRPSKRRMHSQSCAKVVRKGSLKDVETRIQQKLTDFRQTRENRHCYPLLLHNTSIRMHLVDDVFDDLRSNFIDCGGKLDVIVDSGGGDINSTYNLALLLRKFGAIELTFFVPRWAKSAATMLVCAGDRIMMSPVAELGPLDPQITELNPMQNRFEAFSPLHIEATLSLIRDEFEKGNEKLANGLIERLQFPLTLGSFKKSLDIAKEYLSKLLSTRMLHAKPFEEAAKIASTLTEGYADHGFCITLDEVKAIGLVAEEIEGEQLNIIWDIHKLCREREEIKGKQKRKKLDELLKNLPPELLDGLPPPVRDALGGPIMLPPSGHND